MKPSDKDRNDVPFGGALGNELRKMWDAIRANQIVSSKDMRVSRTTKGTIVEAVGAASSTTIKNTTGADSGLISISFDVSDQTVTGPLSTTLSGGGGIYPSKPWIEVPVYGGNKNCLFQPLTRQDFLDAEALWGTQQATDSVVWGWRLAYAYSESYWADLVFPKPQYIGHQESGKWSARIGALDEPIFKNSLLAMPLFDPFPMMPIDLTTYTQQAYPVTLPMIHYIEMHAYKRWEPIA